jgi:hypothetical protein
VYCRFKIIVLKPPILRSSIYSFPDISFIIPAPVHIYINKMYKLVTMDGILM